MKTKRTRWGLAGGAALAVASLVATLVPGAVVSESNRASGPRAKPRRPATVSLVGLGDSVPAATGCPCTSFVELFGAGIAQRTGTSVRVDNLGVPGMTSTDLLTALSGGGPFASAVADADVVTITIGANDFQHVAATGAECPGSNGVRCYRPTLRFMKGNLQSIIERIKVLRTRRPTDIQITGYWDIWADGAVARAKGYRYVEVGNDLTKLVNRSIAEVANAESVRSSTCSCRSGA